MAIDKKLIYIKTESRFNTLLNNNEINQNSIVFIEDTKRIWTHGNYFDGDWGGITGKPTDLVTTSRTITAGNGLSGGGSLSANRTITLGDPSDITLSSTNSVTTTSHTHAFTPGGTTSQYIRGDGSLATYVNTTYTNMTAAEISAGTVTTGRIISAKVLNDWLNAKNYSLSGHTHSASDINSGTLAIARIPTGTTSSTVALGNDSRINNGQTAYSWGNHSGLYPSIASKGGGTNSIIALDSRSVDEIPNTDRNRGLWIDFKSSSTISLTGMGQGAYSTLLTLLPYSDSSGNSTAGGRIALSNGNLYVQKAETTSYNTWKQLAFKTDISDYSLPTATQTVLGGVKLGSNTLQTVASNLVTSTASRSYAIQANSSGELVVNVPWTNTDTTYSAGTKALLEAGTNTTNRVWSAKILNDWFVEGIENITDSDIFAGTTFSSNVIDLTNVNGAFNVNQANGYSTYTFSNKKVRGAWAKVLVNSSIPISITGMKLLNTSDAFELNKDMYLNVYYDGVNTIGYYSKYSEYITESYYMDTSNVFNMFNASNTPFTTFTTPSTSTSDPINIGGRSVNKSNVKSIFISDNYDDITSIESYFLQRFSNLTSVNLSGLTNVTSIGGYFLRDCSSLTSLDLSPLSNVTSIGNYFLINMGTLSEVKMGAINPPTLGYGSFNSTTVQSIKVPSQSIAAYKSAWGWSAHASIITGY